MKVTLTVLLACIAIYCNRTSLSLPPSFIANAAALRQQQLQHQQNSYQQLPRSNNNAAAAAADANALKAQWAKKDATNILPNFDVISGIPSFYKDNNNNNKYSKQDAKNGISNSAMKTTAQLGTDADGAAADYFAEDLDRQAYDLDGYLDATPVEVAVEATNLLQPPTMPKTVTTKNRGIKSANTLLTPLKYWARHCQQLLDYENCPQEYYRAMLSGSNQRAGVPNDYNELLDNVAYNKQNIQAKDDIVDNDAYMMVTGEQDVIKLLSWAMKQLYPNQRFTNLSANGADFYHPGMYIWKKLNLSGYLEPPLFAEEPRYVIVRREHLNDDDKQFNLHVDRHHESDPFIPPRGRKHNMPDLEVLLHRYETFVPNRGKKDKIKDIFKYDDLFYPNRGKRQSLPTATAAAITRQLIGNQLELLQEQKQQMNDVDESTLDDNLTATPSVKAARVIGMQRMLGKLKRKLQQAEYNKQELLQQQQENYLQQLALNAANEINDGKNNNNNNNEWPTNSKMSTHQINAYDQSVKQSMSAIPTATTTTPLAQILTRDVSTPTSDEAAAEAEAEADETTVATTNYFWQLPALLKWHAMKERPRRHSVNGVRIPANRLYSTGSMSSPVANNNNNEHEQYHTKAAKQNSFLNNGHTNSFDPFKQLKQQQRQQQLQDISLATLLSNEFDAMHDIYYS